MANLRDKTLINYELIRVLLLSVIFYAAIVLQLFQPQFINVNYLLPMYMVFFISFSGHTFNIISIDFFRKRDFWIQATFYIDTLLISYLVFKSGFNQSIFLFLNLMNIMFYGFLYQQKSAVYLALTTAIVFNFMTIFSEDLRGIQLILFILLNNISFLAVAYLSGSMSDQLKNVDQELGLQKILFQTLLDKNKFIVQNIPTGILTLTPGGEVLQNNPSAEKILYNNQLLKANIFSTLKDFKIEKLNEYFDYNYVVDQEIKTLQVKLSPSRENNIEALIMLIEDVTELRQMQSQLRQSEKLAAIGQLAAGIAHEIRNPLTGISGSIQLMSQNQQSDEDKKLMGIVLKEIDRLNNLISEFLDFAKPMRVLQDKVNLAQVINECLSSVKNSNSFNQSIQYEVSLDPALILGDAEKLKQVFLNIMINACQSMEKSSEKKILVSLNQDAKNYVVTIKDSGSGMSEEVKKRIFEAFYTTKPKGTGLGLAMSYRILEHHQAQVEVNSKVGQGTEFKISFRK